MDDARRERIIELCAEGDQLAKQRELLSALLKFREAMALIPRPVEEHDLSLQVLTSLGDICFQLGRFSEGKYALQGAVRSSGGLGQPLVHLRLGQCELELGNLERAADELARAYKGGGEELFASENPKYLEFVQAPHQR
jgi:tetratricopeptide (TPR) repeat protein